MELYPEFIREVEDLNGIDVGYRKGGALDVIVEEEISTTVARRHRIGVRVEALSFAAGEQDGA